MRRFVKIVERYLMLGAAVAAVMVEAKKTFDLIYGE
jgi:hypothetical protein